MTKMRDTTPELEQLHREAVVWVQRLVSGQATADDAAALRRWRAQSPAHARAFADANRAWSDVAAAGRELQGTHGAATATLVRLRRQSVNRRAFLGGGLATAAAATYGILDPPLALWPSLSQLRADYRTATGEQRSITLAGDVDVHMNTQTSLAIRPPEGGRNRVELIAGEASFGLPPGEARLAVLAADGSSSTRGARFEVQHLLRGADSAVHVTCLDGIVDVEHLQATATLHAGQQLRYDARGIGAVSAVDPDNASNWSRGIVAFRATPLSDAVEEINRYRPGHIVVLSAELAQKRITGRFRIDQMDSILTRLAQAADAKVRTLPGGLALLS